MLAESQNPSSGGDTPKLRAACENCRQSKVKCNLGGKNACVRCLRHGLPCRYRVANRSGKPKGSKNRATLRKLGQLQDEKLSSQGSQSPREPKEKAVEPVCPADYEVDRSFDYQTSEPSQPRLSESPHMHNSHPTIDACMLVNETPIDYTSSYGAPFSPAIPMYTTPASLSPTSPTFLQKEFITKGLTSFPLAVHVPGAVPRRCECDEALGFHMNGLRHMVVDTTRLRFDQSLQAIKTALSVCQGFLRCTSCPKGNTNILSSVSTLDLVLQLFDYWLSCEFAVHGPPPSLEAEPVAYGEYETGPEEARHMRRVVLRGRLMQCQEVLGLLHEAVEQTEGQSSSNSSSSEALDGSWLQQIIRGYASTTESFLQPLLGCICGSTDANQLAHRSWTGLDRL